MGISYDQALVIARQKAAQADFGSPFRYLLTKSIPAYIRKYCVPDARILDVGCGSGRYAYFFVEAGVRGSYTGIDIQPQSLDGFELADLFSSRLLVMDAHRLNELGEKFDFVMSLMAFEHFEDDRAVIRGMAGVMSAGAHALICVPSRASLAIYGRHGYRRYGRGRIADLASRADLKTVEIVPVGGAAGFFFHMAWFLPALAARFAGKAVLYALHGMDKEASRRALPGLHEYLDRMGEHHLRLGWGRRLHRAVLRACETADRFLPFLPSGYIAVLRKPL